MEFWKSQMEEKSKQIGTQKLASLTFCNFYHKSKGYNTNIMLVGDYGT
jgi:hypothetical protein